MTSKWIKLRNLTIDNYVDYAGVIRSAYPAYNVSNKSFFVMENDSYPEWCIEQISIDNAKMRFGLCDEDLILIKLKI